MLALYESPPPLVVIPTATVRYVNLFMENKGFF
jgi:hypothetical protein